MNKNKEIKKMLLITTVTVLAFTALLTMPFTSAQKMQEPQIDIYISDITFSNDEPADGDVITISATIVNNASFDVNNISISFYVDYEEIGNKTGINMEANGTAIQNIEWIAESGDHTISAILSIDDMALMDTQTSEDIFVTLGDISTLIYALLLIILIIFGTAVVPSILRRLKDGNSKRGM